MVVVFVDRFVVELFDSEEVTVLKVRKTSVDQCGLHVVLFWWFGIVCAVFLVQGVSDYVVTVVVCYS